MDTMDDGAWFVAKDVCEILGTRTDNVRKIVGNKRVATVNPYQIGVGKLGALSPIWWWIMVLVSDIIKKQACTSGMVGSFCNL